MSAASNQPLFCLDGSDLSGRADDHGQTGVTIKLVSNASVLRIMPFLNKPEAIAEALAPYGFSALPAPGRFDTSGAYRLAWAGQSCWHLIRTPQDVAPEKDLAMTLGKIAAISNATDGLLQMQIEGSKSRTLMSKGCVLDLDRFLPGHCAVSLMVHTKLFICRLSKDRFQIMIPASHAASFWEWLGLSAAEFGFHVDPGHAD